MILVILAILPSFVIFIYVSTVAVTFSITVTCAMILVILAVFVSISSRCAQQVLHGLGLGV